MITFDDDIDKIIKQTKHKIYNRKYYESSTEV